MAIIDSGTRSIFDSKADKDAFTMTEETSNKQVSIVDARLKIMIEKRKIFTKC